MAMQSSFPQRSGPPRRDGDAFELVLPLPAQTVQFIERQQQLLGSEFVPENLGLWLDRLIPVNHADRKEPWGLSGEARHFALTAWCGRRYKSQLASQALARQRESVTALHSVYDSQGNKKSLAVSVRAKQHGRLLMDGGRAHPLSTSLSFHPQWGVPRIAGSALKGAVLSLAKAEGADVVAAMGTEGAASQVVFYEALPVDGAFTLALDVVTPHYGQYYTGNEPPSERMNPVPHSFLTVVETTFEFWLAVEIAPADGEDASQGSGKLDAKIAQALKTLDEAKKYLKLVLSEWGVGGKTSAGYGRFVIA